MPWWLAMILGIILVLGSLSQMVTLGQPDYGKAGVAWGKPSKWTVQKFVLLLFLISLGLVSCVYGLYEANFAFNSMF